MDFSYEEKQATVGSSKKRLEYMHYFLPFYLLDYYIIFISIWNLCSYLSKIDVEQKVKIQITGGKTYTEVRTQYQKFSVLN